jgi:hypothetical protein
MWTDWPRRGLTLLVQGYRLLLSPWLGSNCRFEPTCSIYALGVLERHGALAGSYLTLKPWAAVGLGVLGATIPCLRRPPPCFLA